MGVVCEVTRAVAAPLKGEALSGAVCAVSPGRRALVVFVAIYRYRRRQKS